jgi:hypothetical protein
MRLIVQASSVHCIAMSQASKADGKPRSEDADLLQCHCQGNRGEPWSAGLLCARAHGNNKISFTAGVVEDTLRTKESFRTEQKTKNNGSFVRVYGWEPERGRR